MPLMPEVIDEPVDAPADTETSDEPVVEVPEWDGTDATLDAQPWYKAAPESAKAHVKSLFDSASQAQTWRTLLDSEDNVAAVTKEMDGLKATLGAEVTKYKTAAETHERAAKEWQGKFTALDTEVKDKHYASRDAEVQSKFPDIHATYAKATDAEKPNSALAMFVKLVENDGIPDDKAAKMVRAYFDMATPGAPAAPERPKTRDVAPPDSIALANQNGLNASEVTKKPPVLSEGEARRRLQEKIEAEEEAESLGR